MPDLCLPQLNFTLILPIIIIVQSSLIEILKQVFTSWQVIVVTIAVLLYMHIVTSAAKKRTSRPRQMKMPKAKKKEEAPLLPTEDSESSSNDELGLEEA